MIALAEHSQSWWCEECQRSLSLSAAAPGRPSVWGFEELPGVKGRWYWGWCGLAQKSLARDWWCCPGTSHWGWGEPNLPLGCQPRVKRSGAWFQQVRMVLPDRLSRCNHCPCKEHVNILIVVNWNSLWIALQSTATKLVVKVLLFKEEEFNKNQELIKFCYII